MQISNKYVVVERIQEPEQEGFKTVDVQDNYVYKGKVTQVPQGELVFMTNRQIAPGDTVLFAKYSPDTHEIEIEGKKVKFVAISDLLAVL